MLCDEIDAFTASLLDRREKLAAGDEAGLRALFVKSTERRRLFDK